MSKLAKLSKNYTGAEIEAVVKSATAWGLKKIPDLMDFSKEMGSQEV